MAEEDSGFKVADRRLFAEDGTLRENVDESRHEASSSQAIPGPADLGGAKPEGEVPLTFETLVLSMSTTAMLQMGVLANPDSGKPETDLPRAKQTIDLLEMLRQKTQGNLNSEEHQLLEASLYDLKMTYLQVSKKIKI